MRKFFTALVLLPLAVILIVFAVANRHLVTVSFDPFNTVNPSLGVTMPLFAVIIAVAIVGVVTGGIATWLGQRRWRRAARLHESDARQARLELANLRAGMGLQRSSATLPALIPASGAANGPMAVSGRDKYGATL